MELDADLHSLLKVLSRPHGGKRIEFLEAAQEMAGDKSAVLVWLYDRRDDLTSSPHELVLDQYYHPSDDGSAPELLVRRRAVPTSIPQEAACRDPAAWHIAIADHPQIHQWCIAKGLGATICEYAYPLYAFPPQQPEELIGVFQILSAQSLPPTILNLLPYLADGLADTILRSRKRRLLIALQQLLPRANVSDTINGHLQSAAVTLHRIIGTEVCLIYRQERSPRLKAVASWPGNIPIADLLASAKSYTYKILERGKPIRVYNFQDADERRRVFGTEEYDSALLKREAKHLANEKLGALMGAPILIDGHGIAVIMLLNKVHPAKSWHLSRHFSRTDQEVLQIVCEFLAGVIPSVEVLKLMERCSGILFAGALKEEKPRQEMFDMLANLIPGLASAALTRSGAASSAPKFDYLGGDRWFSAADLRPQPSAKPISVGTPSDGRHMLQVKIPNLLGEPRYLVLGLLRPDDLSPYELKLIDIFSKELSQALRGEQELERELKDLVQIRHTVRSGLTGAIGHITTALNSYEVCEQEHFAPLVFAAVNLGDDLHWANHFAKKMQVLMEESRFLLSDISRNSLRIGSGSVTSLVELVIKSVAPFAKLRKIEIKLVNRVSADADQVPIDFQLVDMLVFNLLDNAVKYSYRDQPVFVDLFIDRGDWKLRVTDFGVYIEEQFRREIFKPFARIQTGDDDTARPGTGLGLAVALKIAKAHGGDIDVDSEVIRTTTPKLAKTRFFLRMPR